MAPPLSYQVKLEKTRWSGVTEDDGKMHTLTRNRAVGWRRFSAWLSDTVGLEAGRLRPAPPPRQMPLRRDTTISTPNAPAAINHGTRAR